MRLYFETSSFVESVRAIVTPAKPPPTTTMFFLFAICVRWDVLSVEYVDWRHELDLYWNAL